MPQNLKVKQKLFFSPSFGNMFSCKGSYGFFLAAKIQR